MKYLEKLIKMFQWFHEISGNQLTKTVIQKVRATN